MKYWTLTNLNHHYILGSNNERYYAYIPHNLEGDILYYQDHKADLLAFQHFENLEHIFKTCYTQPEAIEELHQLIQQLPQSQKNSSCESLIETKQESQTALMMEKEEPSEQKKLSMLQHILLFFYALKNKMMHIIRTMFCCHHVDQKEALPQYKM